MRKVVNFSAGPAMLPEEVLLQAQAEMLDWKGTGMSVMEVGHRGKDFMALTEKIEADLRELMSIPKNYQVLFVSGGASHQFSMVPLNLLGDKKIADYIETGIWSGKAAVEARRYGTINIAALTENNQGILSLPPQNKWTLNPNASYVHYTPNETIEGVEFHWVPNTGNVPLVADMTSMILSRPVDMNLYGVIYAGAQKNMGHAGISVVIIRDDLIREPLPNTPTLYTYQVYAENKSLYNTPPTYSWYITGLVLEWMKREGGLAVFGERNQRKAQKIYAVIDSLADFYTNNVHPDCRSIMNVPFNLKNSDLTQTFLDEAKKVGLVNLKGHRLAGGVRASIYNPMPEKSVDLLVEFMNGFAKKFG